MEAPSGPLPNVHLALAFPLLFSPLWQILISITLIALYVGVLLPAAYRHIRFRPTELAVLKDKCVDTLLRPTFLSATIGSLTRPSLSIRTRSFRAGWGAILVAMMVSSGAGVVLERSITTFESLAVLAPLMNGLGGNLAVVHASKLSTALHTNAKWVFHCRGRGAEFFR